MLMKTALRHNRIRRSTLILTHLWTIAFVLLFLSGHALAVTKELAPVKKQSDLCAKIVRTLERYHYLEKNLDNTMSSEILDRYIKHLDPRKQLFTLGDIASFSPYRNQLDDALKRGQLDIPYKIFNVYMQRSKKRFEFILSQIKTWETDMNLEGNDELLIDDELKKWQPDQAALLKLWKKELKNHIISLLLDDPDHKTATETLEKVYTNRQTRLLQTEASDVFQDFINIVTTDFDPHTQFFAPRLSEDFDIHMSLSLEGIGAVLQTEYEYTKVIRLIPKGPADKSGLLMPGDKIVGVGQGDEGDIIDTIGQRIDHVVKLIRGPKGTFVRLKIIPAEKSASTKTIQIKRDKVKLEEQAAKKEVIKVDYEGRSLKIGVIEIPNFYIDFNALSRGDANYKSTTRDVIALLKELEQEKIDGLIVDLRDNGGGSLQEASQLTGVFLTEGPTVQIRTKYRIRRYYDDDPAIYYNGPLMVLMNRMSASASEIFAGAIKDYHRGIIVGSRSFGKGTVQELQKLDEGKLKLTTAKFYRVSGESTQHMGVLPDIKFPRLYDVDNTGESSLEGALPWDTTIRSPYKAYPLLDPIVNQLNEKYKKRAAHDPGIQYLEKRLQLTSDLRSQKELSLNLKKRRQFRQDVEQKELGIENEYLKAMGKPELETLDKTDNTLTDAKEILMKQTQLLMADFIFQTQEYGYRW